MLSIANLTDIEVATVLAGLRVLQQKLNACNLPDDIEDIATNGGHHAPLDAIQIDTFCERINATDAEPHPFRRFVE